MLQNTSVQGLTASGKTWLSNTSITGQTDINVTGTATTTIGGATTALNSTATTVAGTLGVTGLTTLSGGATVTGTTNVNATGSGTTIIGSSSSATTALNSVATTVGGTLGVTALTTLSGGVKTNSLTSTATTGALTIAGDQTSGGTVVIGTTSTRTTINGTTVPLVVKAPNNNGARFDPVDGQNNRGNLSIGGCFPSLGPGDIGPRRVCDIFGGFSSNSWGSEYMSLCVGNNGTANDGDGTATVERMRINGAANTTVRIGQVGYRGISADNTTLGLECSRHTIDFAGYHDNDIINRCGASITCINRQLWTTVTDRKALQGGDLVFSVAPDYDGRPVDRMTIRYNGNVGIGAINPTYTLDVSGTLGVTRLTTLSGGVTVTGNTSINTTGSGNTTIGNTNGFTYLSGRHVTVGSEPIGGLYNGAMQVIGNSNAVLMVIPKSNPDNTVSHRGNIALYASFIGVGPSGGGDHVPRRAADIYAGYTYAWTTEYLGFAVGGGDGNGRADDTQTTERMRIQSNGNVGIGTSGPSFPLHVAISADDTSTKIVSKWFDKNNSTGLATAGESTASNSDSYNHNISIYSEYSIMSKGAFVAASDRRIKTNIVDIDDERALRDLRLLKPKTYTYKDVIQKGYTPVYGFIAQEVKEVLDHASKPMTDTIPNIYELATFVTDTLTLAFNTTDLSRDASGTLFTKLKVMTKEGKDEFVNILEVIDEHTIKVDKDLTEWGGALDASGQLVPGDKIFVYGQEVNDFHNLNKDAIWTVATAALQEVDRQLQAEKQKTAALQTAFDALLERVIALEQKSTV